MISILAHRANTAGPDRHTENTPLAIQRALSRGWGIETDIRRAGDGRFYLSHDPKESADGVEADVAFALCRQWPRAPIALNIKELGDEETLLRYLDAISVAGQVFLFDMELLEPEPGSTARLMRALHPVIQLAARVSDRGESIEQALSIEVASVVWLDEFDGPWADERDISRLKNAGRTVYAISPDLHGSSLNQAKKRWIQFCSWGIDGICTDYPNELERVL